MKNNLPATEKKVLITGGSGLIGRYLTSLLLGEGYDVAHLSRKQDQFGRVRVFRWDPDKGIVDPIVFDGVNFIVHLAGANIGEKRWSDKRKMEIESSRVDSAKLLFKVISENNIPLKAFISASAFGYYGSVTTEKIFSENDPPADDFLGTVCRKWEEAADLFSASGTRIVKIRTGVVMENNDSALAKLLTPAGIGVFPRLGSGRQYMPWIHINDLCNIYLKAIQDESMSGPYNAVSPQHITQSEFVRTLAFALNKSFFNPPVPAFILRMALGNMADLVLKGSRISSEKLIGTGFKFRFSNLKEAIKNALDRKD
ncbi:MAG: TIGR01777 family protein [Bacteroidetes bacterium GWE2_41_25]|nr:MAG: TIGR01777 family protein [Bacteroidetes bacterium GWA2_40_15]OFX87914.1 MAG: TIGR01777 family protein [Bacteroidetes bacterium GWC2_40_22]OFY05420.1 MAG: TIGR01777 family protein [Bacteroidetes bacterium GWE2_41_25]HBH82459.1 TIGR01777 family protein [Bacteroidales bacterium]HBQ82522.1 TIGR01777 family protein [Bacteroidales bacterium]